MILQIFGQITPPYKGYSSNITGGNFGLVALLNNILKLFFVIGGLLAFFNLVVAAFQFLNSGGDPKAIEQAWSKIWQSLVGLIILVISFIIAGLIGWIFFGDVTAILSPQIYGP